MMNQHQLRMKTPLQQEAPRSNHHMRVFCIGDSMHCLPTTHATEQLKYPAVLQNIISKAVSNKVTIQTLYMHDLSLRNVCQAFGERSTLLDRMARTENPLLIPLVGLQEVRMGLKNDAIVEAILYIHRSAHMRNIRTLLMLLPENEATCPPQFVVIAREVNLKLMIWAESSDMVDVVSCPFENVNPQDENKKKWLADHEGDILASKFAPFIAKCANASSIYAPRPPTTLPTTAM